MIKGSREKSHWGSTISINHPNGAKEQILFRNLVAATLVLSVCAIARADNVIYVTGGTENTDYTIDQANATVQLLYPHTSGSAYTIWADDTTTEGELGDGYINAVTLDSRQPSQNEDYKVRIARLVTGTTYTYGAKYVGYVDICDGNHRRGFLGMVLVKGYWGKKVVSGSVVDVNPAGGEITELFQAGGIGEFQPRFQIDVLSGDADSGTVAEYADLIVGVGNGAAASTGWNLSMVLGRDFRGTLETRDGADINEGTASPHWLYIQQDLTGTIKCREDINAKIVIGRDLTGSIIANEDGNDTQSGQGAIRGDVAVLRHMTGAIKSLTRSGAGGKFDGHIDIAGDYSGLQGAPALIEAQGGLDTNGWVRLNYDGALPGTWTSTYASVVLGGTTYTSGNDNAGLHYINHNIEADMDFNDLVNNFDIDPFTDYLANCNADPQQPWLDCAAHVHGDLGPAVNGVCGRNGVFNNFDIDCFVERVTAGATITAENVAPPIAPCCD